MDFITTFCTPAKVYLLIASIGFVVMLFNKPKITRLIPIIVPLWTLLLNWLCSNGLTELSWGFVIIQIILICIICECILMNFIISLGNFTFYFVFIQYEIDYYILYTCQSLFNFSSNRIYCIFI